MVGMVRIASDPTGCLAILSTVLGLDVLFAVQHTGVELISKLYWEKWGWGER